jgi:sterol desaturase/sphingolipid hydroxylase (fatty acid hydroxylase superfamily)
MGLYSGLVAAYGDAVGGLDPELRYFAPVFVWAVLTSTYIVVGALFLSVDLTHLPRWLYDRKLQPDAPFIVGGSSRNPSLANTLSVLGLAHAVSLATFLGMQWFALRLGLGSAPHSALPSTASLLAQAIAWVLLAETSFYFSHRLFHVVPFLYQSVHKTHHQFKAPIAISAMYAHPVEVVFSNIGAHMLWPFLFQMHPGIIALGVAGGMTQSMLDHCGYWYSISPKAFQPFFHDAHHRECCSSLLGCANICRAEFFLVDFGFLGLWDRLLRTSNKWRAVRTDVVARVTKEKPQ